jgi:hypothetical protein
MVNTTTAGQQIFSSISAQTDGGYTVSWLSANDCGCVAYTALVQRYDAAGNKVGGETALAMGSLGSEGPVAVLTNGEIVVARGGAPAGSPAGTQAISVLRFDRSGVLIGSTEVASQAPAVGGVADSLGETIQLAPLANGGFAVAWNVVRAARGGSTIFSRRFDAEGVALGGPVLIGPDDGFPRSRDFTLVPDAHGGYTMQVHRDFSTASVETLVHFDANGTALEVARPGLSGVLLLPLAGDRFLFFSHNASDAANVWFREFLDSAGNPVGSPVAVDSTPGDAKELADGSYVLFTDPGGNALTVQRFDANGAALGEAVAVASASDPLSGGGRQGEAAALPGGGFAFGWSNRAPGAFFLAPDADVFTQRVLVQN